MATKNNPGAFDCYADAAPDEPIFVLRANDELASHLVELWALIRSEGSALMIEDRVEEMKLIVKKKSSMDHNKFMEAFKCSADMRMWRLEHDK